MKLPVPPLYGGFVIGYAETVYAKSYIIFNTCSILDIYREGKCQNMIIYSAINRTSQLVLSGAKIIVVLRRKGNLQLTSSWQIGVKYKVELIFGYHVCVSNGIPDGS
jgi:hypothetical protein